MRSTGIIPLILLPAVGLALGLVAVKEYHQEQLATYHLLQAHSLNASVQVSRVLSQIDRQLHQMASEQLKDHPAKHTLVFGRNPQSVPDIYSWMVTDAAGRIHDASDAAMLNQDVSKEPYFTVHRGPGPVMAMHTSRPDNSILGVTAMVFTLPIVADDGQFLGIVGMTTGFEFFPQALQPINPNDSASMLILFNRDGDLLFQHTDPENLLGYSIAAFSKVLKQHIAAARPMTRHIGPSVQNGKTRLFLVRDVPNTQLSLIVSRPLDEVLAVWYRSVVIYLLTFALIAVLVIYLAIVAKRSRHQVLVNKAFSDQLIATASVMVVGQDARGHITIFNQAAERITGYSRNDVLGQRWFDFALPPDTPPDVMAMVGLFRDGGKLPHSTEYAIRDKSGQDHIISWENSVVEAPYASVSFGIDVTQRKKTEEELVMARRRAESSSAAKSRFLAAISHDVRQPLHAQALFLDVLASTKLTARQRELLESANDTAKSCGEMLNTLLDFSRIEAGIMTPRLQSFGLQPIFNKIEREFGPQADAKGIVYRSLETDFVVQSDPMLLELILRNFVSNAIRHTGRGGLLVSCRKRGTEALLEVWDTGIGIATADQQAVFGEFFQLGNPELDIQKGLGLGLAIADSLARALNHRLTLASKPHRGSVFRLYLPIAL